MVEQLAVNQNAVGSIPTKKEIMLIFLNLNFLLCEAAENFQNSFQEPATSEMDGIFLFNCHLLFVIISIVLIVWWLLYLIYDNFLDNSNSVVLNFTHSSNIEIVWTTVPALILLSLASPSFSSKKAIF